MRDRLLWLFGLLVPIAIVFSIWIPPLSHYWVASPSVEQPVLDRLRTLPTEAQLLEIERQNLALPLRMDDAEILEAAARLRAGELALKGYPAVAVSLGFDRMDLRKGLPTWGLHFGSLAGTEILARAYEISRNEIWLSAALQHATGFIEHERGAWLPEGFLWNDHAISGRISVLIKLWRLYRNHPDYSPETGRIILEHILRCRNLLAKDSQFTFNTNHGVMQNVSLLQIAAAFPGLPGEQRYRTLAVERLDRQLGFYVSNEGVVLEHSAEYHALGIELISMSTRLLQILGEPVRPRWSQLQLQATGFLDLIRLPDDSLPMFGNTNSTPDFPPAHESFRSDPHSACTERQGLHSYPVAGYAVLWTCGRHSTQSIMALSQFVGHGHKHADELSLLTWTRGTRWLTSVGYWPYGVPGNEDAYGWEGSNAPHWQGEATIGERDPRLLASASTADVSFLDARRKGRDGTEFRRQVLQIGQDWWIVLDFAQGPPNAEAEVLWSFFPGTAVSAQENGTYLASQGEDEMLVNIADTGNISHRVVMAERSPWRGWVVKERVPAPAATILTHFPAGSPLVSSFRVAGKEQSERIKMELIAQQGPEAWELAIDVAGAPKASIKRHPEGHIELKGIGTIGNSRLMLTPEPDVRAERAAIRSAYASLETEFPRYREVFHYRVRLTKLLLLIAFVQQFILSAIWKFSRRAFPFIQALGYLMWIAAALLIHLWYFAK